MDALLLYADHDNNTRRNVAVGTTTRHARAEFDSNSSGIGARIGYRLTNETSPLVRPFAELYYDRIDGAQFTERGALAGNLRVCIHDREGLRGAAGLVLAHSYEGFGRVFRPSLEVAVSHQFEDAQSTLDVRPVADGDAFRTYGSKLDRTAYLAKASLEITLWSNALVKLGNSGELASDYSHHQADLALRIVW